MNEYIKKIFSEEVLNKKVINESMDTTKIYIASSMAHPDRPTKFLERNFEIFDNEEDAELFASKFMNAEIFVYRLSEKRIYQDGEQIEANTINF